MTSKKKKDRSKRNADETYDAAREALKRLETKEFNSEDVEDIRAAMSLLDDLMEAMDEVASYASSLTSDLDSIEQTANDVKVWKYRAPLEVGDAE